MTNDVSDTDYRWLVGPGARRWLDEMAQSDDPLHLQVQRLRRELSLQQTHLVVEQTQLREQAKLKFAAAEQMFFTRIGLEQSTDQWVAAYKAERFASGKRVADLCCGIGGDLLGLNSRGPATGVDLSPVHAVLAEANCRALHGGSPGDNVRNCDVEQIDLASFDAWHIDPDRRAQGRRTTKVMLHKPAPSVIEKLLAANAQAVIKLAPAAELPDRWYDQAHLEWISRSGQCRQLVAWFGGLAPGRGTRSATVLSTSEQAPRTISASVGIETSTAESIGRYLYEPDSAVLAAGLIGALADEHQLSAIAPGHAYLTSDSLRKDPLMASFEVTDVVPFQRKRLKQLFRDRGVGRLEVKKRGVVQDPAVLQKQLRSTGDAAATLLLARVNDTVTAIIARRVV